MKTLLPENSISKGLVWYLYDRPAFKAGLHLLQEL